MQRESRELWSFLRQTVANPHDADLRQVFADWLDDHDEPEEANAQRQLAADIISGKFAANEYVDRICALYEVTREELDEMIADNYVNSHESLRDEICGNQEFWDNYETATGKTVDEDTRTTYFRCGC